MAWISHDPDDDKSTPKFFAFRKKFNWPPYQALGFLCAFWINVLKSETYETGEISDWTGEFLADRIGVGNVNPNELWEALVDGYVETKSDGRRLVRDWIKIAGPWLRQKYANREHGKERLRFIWSLHGLPYGREPNDQKSPESRPKEAGEYAESSPTVGLQSRRSAPPDIIKEPPKDGEEEEGEGNASFSPSWETEGKKEAAMLPASRPSKSVELDEAPEVDRRDDNTRPQVHLLLDKFSDRLSAIYGESASFSYGPWGKFLKLLLKEHAFQEIIRRFENWVTSTDPYIRQNRNSAGAFYNRFNELKTGPISNHGSRTNGAARAPFDDGAATVRAGPESTF